jgi:predicted membrane metal-binding protein
VTLGFLRRNAFIFFVASLWIVLVVVELLLGLRQMKNASDPLSQLFAVPSSWFFPVRAALMKASSSLHSVGGELLPGLAIGDTSRVSEGLSAAMKTSSLTHLVAVSGANCQIVTATIFALLSWIRVPRWARILGAGTGLVAFVALVTPGASISRAAVMSVLCLLGWQAVDSLADFLRLHLPFWLCLPSTRCGQQITVLCCPFWQRQAS